ncbi:hypothetical protein AURDEDRAFT_185646 [Auricularia subglabra TFB-10046 SS5]|nr:hypothetical protein AURDEDRAFT_185646 [Auricularia subglabra TFB-10046 SS5]
MTGDASTEIGDELPSTDIQHVSTGVASAVRDRPSTMMVRELTIGVIEIGVALALFLTGIMVMQALHYFRTYKDDSCAIRSLVSTLCVAEVIHSALLSNAVYYYTISAAGTVGGVGAITLSMQASMAFIGPMQFAVRTWFCFVRVRRLSGRVTLSIFCWIPVLSALVLALGGVIITSRRPVWEVAKTPTFRGLAISMFCISATADALIAAVTCWNMLVRFTLCSGLLTSVGSVAEAVTYLVWRNFVFLAICIVVAKLFSISLLASLNDRLAIATPAVVGLVLAAVGFGAGGVAAGSLAALWQSTIGNVAAGSLFAILQSVGAIGVGVGVALGAGVVAADGDDSDDEEGDEGENNDDGGADGHDAKPPPHVRPAA